MKKIGFLSFGHWTPSSQSQARSASDVLLQSIDLAVAVEQLGADGAYFRVHHFARQLASPFPLLAAVLSSTNRTEANVGPSVVASRVLLEPPLSNLAINALPMVQFGARTVMVMSQPLMEPTSKGVLWLSEAPS